MKKIEEYIEVHSKDWQSTLSIIRNNVNNIQDILK